MPFAPVHPGSTVGPGVYGPTPEPAQGPAGFSADWMKHELCLATSR